MCTYEIPRCELVASPQIALSGQLVSFTLNGMNEGESFVDIMYGDGGSSTSISGNSISGHSYTTT